MKHFANEILCFLRNGFRITAIMLSLLICLGGCGRSSHLQSAKRNNWYPWDIVWSPRETYVAVERVQIEPQTGRQIGGEIQVVSTTSGTIYMNLASPVLSPVWVNDRSLLMGKPQVINSRRQVSFQIIDCDTMTMKAVPIRDAKVRVPVLAVSGNWVVSLSHRGNVVEIVELATGNIRALKNVPKVRVGQIAYNEDTNLITLFDKKNKSILIYNIKPFQLSKSIKVGALNLEAIYWADTRYLLAIAFDGNSYALLKIDTKKSVINKIISKKFSVSNLSVSEKGLCIVALKENMSDSTTWAIIDWQTGRLICRFSPEVVGTSISPSGTKVFLIYKDQTNHEQKYSVLKIDQAFNLWCRR